jgi:hypothetical protein
MGNVSARLECSQGSSTPRNLLLNPRALLENRDSTIKQLCATRQRLSWRAPSVDSEEGMPGTPPAGSAFTSFDTLFPRLGLAIAAAALAAFRVHLS